MIRKWSLALALVLSAPAAALADDFQMNANGGGTGFSVSINANGFPAQPPPQPAQQTSTIESSEQSYRLSYETNPDGVTLLKVLSPEGALCTAFDGKNQVASDDIPMSFEAQPDHFYRVVIRLADGRTWEKKIAAKRKQVGTLWVKAPAPAQPPPQQVIIQPAPQPPPQVIVQQPPPQPVGPQPMPEGDFHALKAAIQEESFPNTKMNVLTTAAGAAYFTVEQVAQLVDLFDFPNDKVGAVRATRPHLLDPQNGFKLYSHFDFPNDKEQVKKILAR